MFLIREITKVDLPPAQLLRADVYVEKGFIDPATLVQGRDEDEFDGIARHAGVYLPTGEIVGTLRIIQALPDRKLQIEKACGIVPEPISASVEASRFVVHQSCRKTNVSFSLIKWFILTCQDMGIETAYAVVEQGLFDNFRAIGLPFERIGPDVTIYNSVNIPIAVKIADMIPGIEAADETRERKLAPFFDGPLVEMFD